MFVVKEQQDKDHRFGWHISRSPKVTKTLGSLGKSWGIVHMAGKSAWLGQQNTF
jgi:hypothetical protein